jgi:Squalene-hopene cyclase N-terminal domain
MADTTAPRMTRAREAIPAHGGAARCNVFTRIMLALRPHDDRRDNGLMIARLLVLWLDGRLKAWGVTTGTCWLVTICAPRAGRA